MLKTTITGSLPKPSWLAQPETLWAPWAAEDPAKLEEAKQDAVRLAIRDQEQAGIDIVTDGEQSRQHFVHGILEKIEGIDFEKKTRIGIRDDRYDADCPTVTSALKRMGSIHGDEVTFARAQTDRALKFTMPGPMTIVDTLADEHYGDRPKMAMAFGEILYMDVVTHTAAIGCGPIAAKHIQLLPAANRHLAHEGEQVVGDAIGVFPHAPRGVGSHRIEIAQAGNTPLIRCTGNHIAEQLFHGGFGMAVGIDGFDRCCFRDRHRFWVAIEGGAAAEHQCAASMRIHGREQGAGAAEVHIPVAQRFGHRFTHRLKPREVDHGVDPLARCVGVGK